MITDLLDKVKFLRCPDKQFCTSLKLILGFYPRNIELYRIAFSHKSMSYCTDGNGRPTNNERMEFLGDAILEAVVSDIVYHRYENKREGFLTNTRSKIVQRSSLNKLAEDLGLDKLVRANHRSNSHNSYIGGNAFEALVGAVYLDRGYKYCQRFIEKRILGSLIDLDRVAQKEENFKSKLLEWSQKNRFRIRYVETEQQKKGEGSPTFRSVVIVEEQTMGTGEGFSKKESEQKAAREAILRLRRDPKYRQAILKDKEKRTAMEAVEYAAPPTIAETAANEAQTERPKRRSASSRHAKPHPGAKEETPHPHKKPAENEMQEETPKRKRRRSRKKAQPAEGPAEQNPSAAATTEAQPDKSREDIIREAEETAFQAGQA